MRDLLSPPGLLPEPSSTRQRQYFFVCACWTMVCYNYCALHESRSGGRCFGLKVWTQISDLKSDTSRRRGKSEHHRAASPLTAGRQLRIQEFKFKIPKPADDKCNREQTSRRQVRFWDLRSESAGDGWNGAAERL